MKYLITFDEFIEADSKGDAIEKLAEILDEYVHVGIDGLFDVQEVPEQKYDYGNQGLKGGIKVTLAEQMKILSKENRYKKDAFESAKEYMEREIKFYARKGKRSRLIDFEWLPGRRDDFLKKYGEEQKDEYRHYNIEEELREYFGKEGFTFKHVTDAVSGGVRQDPYWIICW